MNDYPHITEGILGEETVAKTNTQRFFDLVEQYFPEAIKDGEVDFTALKEEMGEFPEIGAEHYDFTWAGKQAAKKEAQADVYGRTLRFFPEESVNPESTENLYIEGDNLEVLKMLRRNYHGAIKMIYIDPPYNTGSDFIYHDDFTMTDDELAELSGDISDGERLQKNTKDGAKYHTNWLNMMYPRLKIAHDLLAEDGVIFISIDDNEQENLKKICDAVFGESNFLCNFIWLSKLGKVGTTETISTVHEYILCYAKEIENVRFNKIEHKNEGRKENLRQWGIADRREDRPSMFYPITIDGVEVYPIKDDGTEGRWRVGKDVALQLLEKGELTLKNVNGIYNIYRNFAPGVTYIPYDTLFLADDVGKTSAGAKYLGSIGLAKMFDFSKPMDLIRHLIIMCCDKDSIILDFFSGSATTAHAVMQLNAEDGGHRKFIMVQFPEETTEKGEAYKAGYKNICEIGKERIRRAAKKIAEENPDAEFDGGFKVFKTTDTTIRWNKLNDKDLMEIEKYSSSTDNDKIDFTDGYNDIDVVYEIMLRHYNIPLSTPIVKLDDISERTYIFAESVVICLEPKITDDLIEKLAAIEPTPAKFILRDSAFRDDIEFKDVSFRRLSALIQNHQSEEEKKSRYSSYTVEFI